MKKILFIFILSLFLPNNASAKNLTIGEDLDLNFAGDVIFNYTNLAPGDRINEEIFFKNNAKNNRNINLSISSQTGELLNQIYLQIIDANNNVIFQNTFSNLPTYPNYLVLSDQLEPQEENNYKFNAYLSPDLDNSWQGRTSNFSLVFTSQQQSEQKADSLSLSIGGGSPESVNLSYLPKTGIDAGNLYEKCPSWILIYIWTIFLFFYTRFYRLNNGKYYLIAPIIVGIIFNFLHVYLDQNFEPTFLCPLFAYAQAIILFVFYPFDLLIKQPSKN